MNQYKVTPPDASRKFLPLHPSGRELLAWAGQHRDKSPQEIQKLLQPFVNASPEFIYLTEYYLALDNNENEYHEKYTTLKHKLETLLLSEDGGGDEDGVSDEES